MAIRFGNAVGCRELDAFKVNEVSVKCFSSTHSFVCFTTPCTSLQASELLCLSSISLDAAVADLFVCNCQKHTLHIQLSIVLGLFALGSMVTIFSCDSVYPSC